MLSSDEKEKINLDFQKDMFDTVWSFALRREGQFVSYFAQIALAIGSVAAALAHENGKYLLLAQIFSLFILAWGAVVAVITNYDYRTNQAIAWALETKFGARNNVIPKDFGTPKGDLIELHKNHLRILGLSSLLVIFIKTLTPDTYQPLFRNECTEWAVLIILFVILLCYICFLIHDRAESFDKYFGKSWQDTIKKLD